MGDVSFSCTVPVYSSLVVLVLHLGIRLVCTSNTNKRLGSNSRTSGDLGNNLRRVHVNLVSKHDESRNVSAKLLRRSQCPKG